MGESIELNKISFAYRLRKCIIGVLECKRELRNCIDGMGAGGGGKRGLVGGKGGDIFCVQKFSLSVYK